MRYREASIIEMARHARELAAAFHIEVHELIPSSAPELAQALTLGRYGGVDRITIAPIRDEATYAIALHEMGHCASPTGSMRSKDNAESKTLMLLEEESAWEWAKRYAIVWTITMQQVELQAMTSYRQSLEDEQKEQIRRMVVKESIGDFLRRTKK